MKVVDIEKKKKEEIFFYEQMFSAYVKVLKGFRNIS